MATTKALTPNTVGNITRAGGNNNGKIAIPTNTSKSTTNAAFAPVPANGSPLADISGLTLAGGMTAGYGTDGSVTSNPPAYPGTYGSSPWQPARIGVMRTVSTDSTQGQIYSLYFIYNPNQIVVNFATNVGQVPPAYTYGTDATGNSLSGAVGGTIIAPNLTNSQSVSWSLIFDRTYDMMFDTNPDDNRGVLRDVAALYNLMGTFDTASAVPQSLPIQVVFAQTASGQLWGFTGFITAATITYGIFRHNMIPSRCEIDLQMMATYIGPQTPAVAANTGSAVSSNGGIINLQTSPNGVTTPVPAQALKGLGTSAAAAAFAGPPKKKAA